MTVHDDLVAVLRGHANGGERPSRPASAQAADRLEQLAAVNALPEHATVSQYRFSMLTEADTSDYFVWDIHVEWRGGDRWAVTRGGNPCLSTDGGWDIECARFIDDRAERDEWLAAHRFDLPTALALAEAELPRMRINGLTAPDILARNETGRA